MTSADALITVWHAKYRYGVWRPMLNDVPCDDALVR